VIEVKTEAPCSKDKRLNRSRTKPFIAKAKEIVIKTEPKRERSSSKKVKFESSSQLGEDATSLLGKRLHSQMKVEKTEVKTKTRKKTPKNKESSLHAKSKFIDMEAEEGEDSEDEGRAIPGK
jgi:hypothetical protein